MLRFFNKPSLKLWECCKSLQLLDSWVLVGMVSPHLPEHTRQWKCHNMLAILQDASIISIFVYLQFILVDTVTHSVVSLCIRTVWVSVHEFKSGELPRVELLGLGLKDSFAQRLCIARFDDNIDLWLVDDFVCFVWFSFKDVVTLLLSKAIVVLCWSRHVSAQWYQYHESSPHWCDLPHCLLYFHVFFTLYRQREHK